MAVVFPVIIGIVPAHAQNLFGFLRAFAPRPAPVPVYQPYGYHPGGELEQPRRRIQTRLKIVPLERDEAKKPIVPKAPGEIDNPVPALLADSSLRPGDMVMFPDGLRVFTGGPGGQHRLADFKPISQGGKSVSRSARKLTAGLRPSENPAWSTDELRSGGKLAANTRDIAMTGSVKRARR